MNFLKFLPLITQIIDTVERTVKEKGKAKQDKAVDLLKFFFATAEDVLGKELLEDPRVDDALRETIDAIVKLQNVADYVRQHPAQIPPAVPQVPPSEAPSTLEPAAPPVAGEGGQ